MPEATKTKEELEKQGQLEEQQTPGNKKRKKVLAKKKKKKAQAVARAEAHSNMEQRRAEARDSKANLGRAVGRDTESKVLAHADDDEKTLDIKTEALEDT